MNLNLTDAEAQTIINALAAVSPSGGGSRTHNLLLKLLDETGLEIDDFATVAM